MEQLVTVENGIIQVAEAAMQKLYDFQVVKKEMEKTEKKIKEDILKAMEKNDIKSFENEMIKITYKAPTTRKIVDTEALKEQGLYDAFMKESPVKASVVMTWK